MVISDAMLAAAMQAAISAGLLKRHSSEPEIEANKLILHAVLCAAFATEHASGQESDPTVIFNVHLQKGATNRF
jgi:hypothetical protein